LHSEIVYVALFDREATSSWRTAPVGKNQGMGVMPYAPAQKQIDENQLPTD